MKITLSNLPKHSLNEIYSGKHWRARKKIKDRYTLLIKNQFKHVFPKGNSYIVEYVFEFRNKPLDASNTVYMLKMIEDVIFESDAHNVVKELRIKSIKGKCDCVTINITEI